MSSAHQADDSGEQKHQIRRQAQANRSAQPGKDELSATIFARLTQLPEYQSARVILIYLDARSEVRTRHSLDSILASGKKLAIPYCRDGELELFHYESHEELELGAYQILEPKQPLRELPSKRLSISEIDLAVIPGVAFDRRGARVGHGKGYYDKLLRQARPETDLVALAFECQVFPTVPTEPHDVLMDAIVTEAAVHPGMRKRP